MNIKKIIRPSIIVEIIVALFIILFVYTGVSKLFDHETFKGVLTKSPLLATSASFISIALPIMEFIIAALLFFPKTKHIGLTLSLAAMIGFTGYLIYMIYFTPKLPCACGGVISKLTWKEHLIFNVVFTLLAIIAVILNRKKGGNDITSDSISAKLASA